MKNYIQDGKSISHTPTVAVTSGQALLIGALLALAINNIPANTQGEFVTEGVFELPKKSTDDVALGVDLYWDDTANELTTTATDNTKVGKAWSAAGNGTATVAVKINA
ncbi:DUF2190 family protein [Shewanella xiamenensis]|uniref:DUF2190 family protein n=1 Tax=Shewanella xiamenensis TaxID=332186 RepID=UPI00313DFA43